MAPRATRVVLDTNVVLSALLFAQGRLAPLRPAWREARFQPLVSAAATKELVRALSYPKLRLSAAEQQELLADYLPYCDTVHMPSDLPDTAACRDPFDIPFLQLAVVGKADHLVTGDNDLLSLADSFQCSVVTAEQLLGMLGRP
jgi:putative PIN family toxin of toxin-antitoxin system